MHKIFSLKTETYFFFYRSWFHMVTRPPAVMYLESNKIHLDNCILPLAADDDLVGDLDKEGGDADGVVEVSGDVEDHLDRVEEAHDRGPHLARVFQVDCMDVLLRCPQEFGIVYRLGQNRCIHHF